MWRKRKNVLEEYFNKRDKVGQGDWREELCRECNLTLYRQLFTKWSFDVESFGNRDSLCNAPQRLPWKVDSPLGCRNSYVRGLIELEDNPTRFVCQSHLNRRPRVSGIIYNALVPGRFHQNHQDGCYITDNFVLWASGKRWSKNK